MSTKTVLTKKFQLESAHSLPNVPDGHKCKRIHGHSFGVSVSVTGPIDPITGWLIDYAAITEAIKPIHAALDHRYLNDVEGLENPTSENLALWIMRRLRIPGVELYSIEVAETCMSSCTVYAE